MEIPAAWWEKAGATDFTPSSEAYAYTPDPKWKTIIVAISEIEEPKCDPGVVELHEDRSLALLRAFVAECPMPPIAVSKLPEHNLHRYKVKDGYHRYHFQSQRVTACFLYRYSRRLLI